MIIMPLQAFHFGAHNYFPIKMPLKIFLLLAYQSENIENQNAYFTFIISKTAYKIWFCFFIHVYLRLARRFCFFLFSHK